MDSTARLDTLGQWGVAFADHGFSRMGADTLLRVSVVAVCHCTNISASALINQANFVLA